MMKYDVKGISISYTPDNARQWGEDVVLLANAIDITKNTAWAEAGFTVCDLFSEPIHTTFRTNCRELLLSRWRKAGLTVPNDFSLDQYHLLVADFNAHLAAVEQTKLIDVENFPVPITKLEERISEICGQPLRVKNPFDQQCVFHFRVIRPNSTDNNPLHRDVWLEDYDNCINLYIPIAGSSTLSSLILVPESHRWPESKIEKTIGGAVMNGMKFNVPAVTAIDGDYLIIRPDPKQHQVLVFSPYLIHGGAANLQQDKTRISLEIRLWPA
jgi:hypothetical protein